MHACMNGGMDARLFKALSSRRLSGLIGGLACGEGREHPRACWPGWDLGGLRPAGSQCRCHGDAEDMVQGSWAAQALRSHLTQPGEWWINFEGAIEVSQTKGQRPFF